MNRENVTDKEKDEAKRERYRKLYEAADAIKGVKAGTEAAPPAEENTDIPPEEPEAPALAPDRAETFGLDPEELPSSEGKPSGEPGRRGKAAAKTKKGLRSFASGLAKLLDEISDADWESAEDDSASTGEPAAPPAPVKTQVELLQEELDGKHRSFAALLSITEEALGPEDGTGGAPSAAALLKKWQYSLKVGECPAMLARLEEICAPGGEVQPREALVRWMAFLADNGVRQVHGGQAELTVSPAERPYYSNGNEFMDGTLCRIEEHPWLCREKLICPGTLSEAAAEDDPLRENETPAEEAPQPQEGEAPAVEQTDGGDEDVRER